MDNIGESGLCCGGGGGHFLLINSLFNFGLGCVTISPPLQVWLINFVKNFDVIKMFNFAISIVTWLGST